jgi:hypothetical protein
MTRAAPYVRVSTDDQTDENQVQALQEVAQRRGYQDAFPRVGECTPGNPAGIALLPLKRKTPAVSRRGLSSVRSAN